MPRRSPRPPPGCQRPSTPDDVGGPATALWRLQRWRASWASVAKKTGADAAVAVSAPLQPPARLRDLSYAMEVRIRNPRWRPEALTPLPRPSARGRAEPRTAESRPRLSREPSWHPSGPHGRNRRTPRGRPLAASGHSYGREVPGRAWVESSSCRAAGREPLQPRAESDVPSPLYVRCPRRRREPVRPAPVPPIAPNLGGGAPPAAQAPRAENRVDRCAARPSSERGGSS